MADVKFEECFLKNTCNSISVENLQQIHDEHIGKYEMYYLGNFYCPECFIAQLSFHPNAKTPHFRSKDVHNKNCSYNFTPATKRQIEEYCKNRLNRDAINRKLKCCLELLIKCNNKHHNVNYNFLNKETQKNYEYFTIDVGVKKKSIRRKKLTIPFGESDYNVSMIFYGTVLLEWDLRKDEVKFLRIKNVNTGTIICSISISKNIYSYILENMKFEGTKVCDIAFLSSMEKKKYFNNCRIKYSSELVINC